MSRLSLQLALVLLACNHATPDPPPSTTAEPTIAPTRPAPIAAEPSIAGAVIDELQAAKRDTATTEARMLHSAAQMYLVRQGACPTSVEALAEAKMIPKVPSDPWGGRYVVACTDQGATLTITSPGADGKPATPDDVVVAGDEP